MPATLRHVRGVSRVHEAARQECSRSRPPQTGSWPAALPRLAWPAQKLSGAREAGRLSRQASAGHPLCAFACAPLLSVVRQRYWTRGPAIRTKNASLSSARKPDNECCKGRYPTLAHASHTAAACRLANIANRRERMPVPEIDGCRFQSPSMRIVGRWPTALRHSAFFDWSALYQLPRHPVDPSITEAVRCQQIRHRVTGCNMHRLAAVFRRKPFAGHGARVTGARRLNGR